MQHGFTQDSIRYRIILIGETEKMNANEEKLLQHAGGNILKNKTTVFYLDENKYLQGNVSPDSREWKTAQTAIRQLYEPLRDKGASVYFMAANSEWNKLATTKGKYSLQEEVDSLLRIVPNGACPDPIDFNLEYNRSCRRSYEDFGRR